jgi:hypothetical protein
MDGTRWCALVIVVVASCAPATVDRLGPVHPGATAAASRAAKQDSTHGEQTPSSRVRADFAREWLAADDSLQAAVNGVTESDGDAVFAAVEQTSDALFPLSLQSTRVTVVTGERNDTRLHAVAGRLKAGWRDAGRARVGFVEYRGRLLRLGFAGRANIGIGEQLLLGRRFGSYPHAYSRTSAGRLWISPSLSPLFAQDVAAMAVAAGPWSATVLRASATGSFDSGATWLAGGYEYSGARAGVAIGLAAHSDVDSAPEAAGGLGRRILWSIHGRTVGKYVEVSGEVAGSLHRTVASLRLGRKRDWSFLAFHAPLSSSVVDPLIDVKLPPGAVRGAMATARCRIPFIVVTGKLLLQHRRVNGGIQRRRQIWMSLRRAGHSDLRWEMALYNGIAHNDVYPREVLGDHMVHDTVVDSRVRAEVRSAKNEAVMHRLRVDYLPGGGDGVVIMVGSRATVWRCEFEWRLSAYSLAQGQAAFVSRPGVGPFEVFSGLYGQGSDLALRLRAQLRTGVRLTGYYGRPHLKGARAYLGLEYVR